MADSLKSLMIGLITALKADATISGFVGSRIYSSVPQQQTFPYIRVNIESTEYDQNIETGMQHTITVQAFCRSAGTDPALQAADIRAAVIALLDRGEANVTLSSGSLVILQKTATQAIIQEPDMETWQSVCRFQATIIDE